jgi:hypothetical protein
MEAGNVSIISLWVRNPMLWESELYMFASFECVRLLFVKLTN